MTSLAFSDSVTDCLRIGTLGRTLPNTSSYFPAMNVFSAFVEPRMLTQFWLAQASGPLELGKKVRWDYKVHGASDEVETLALEPGRRLEVRWSDGSTALWNFTATSPSETLVHIEQSVPAGEKDNVAATLVNFTEGYTLVLCDLKVLLESGTSPNLVADKAAVTERRLAAGENKNG